jgi:hypothetical protein
MTLLIVCLFADKSVTESSDRLNESWFGWIRLELFPEMADMHIDGSLVLQEESWALGNLDEAIPGERYPYVIRHMKQEFVLDWCQTYLTIRP